MKVAEIERYLRSFLQIPVNASMRQIHSQPLGMFC